MSQDEGGEGVYDAFQLLYVLPDPEEDAEGWYVRIHEVIAILRFEALMAREEGTWESVQDCLDAIADAFADQAVLAMEEMEK